MKLPAFCLMNCKRKIAEQCKDDFCPYWNFRLVFVNGLYHRYTKEQFDSFDTGVPVKEARQGQRALFP
jgi:hypothetical protein